MLVRELIAVLKRYDQNIPVAIEWDGGWSAPAKFEVAKHEMCATPILVIDCNEYGTFRESVTWKLKQSKK